MNKKNKPFISIEGWELPEGTQDITPKGSDVPIYSIPEDPSEAIARTKLSKQHEQNMLQESKKEEYRASALEKLKKLGLTEEEIKAIIGI